MKGIWVYVIDNDKVNGVFTDNVDEVKCIYGDVFYERTQAVQTLRAKHTVEPPIHELSEKEIKEQYAWAKSMMTETEIAEAKKERKSLDEIQWEWVMEMRGLPVWKINKLREIRFPKRQMGW